MPVFLYDDGQDREINTIVSGRIYQTDKMMVCRLKAKGGEAINPHSHDVDQITVMLGGCLEWQIEGGGKNAWYAPAM